MNSRSSTRAFRPLFEPCESRDLAAAGLTSSMAHADVHKAHHRRGLQNYAYLAIKDGTTHNVRFDFFIRNPTTGGIIFAETRELAPGGEYSRVRSYVGYPPAFTVEFERVAGNPSTRIRPPQPLSPGTKALPSEPTHAYIVANGPVYTFFDRTSGGVRQTYLG